MRPRATSRLALTAVLALVAGLFGCSRSEAPAGGGGSGGAASVTGPGGGRAGVLEKIRFQTDWYPEAEHGGFYQALAKGWYQEAGLDVQIQSGGPGATVPQLVLSGAAEIAMARSDDLITTAGMGLPFVIVGGYMEHDPQALLVHEEGPVKSFPDLAGQTVMAAPSMNWIAYLKARYHIEFNLIPLNFGIAQFMADKNFIQQCFVTNEPYYVRLNGGHPRTLLLSDAGYDPYRVIFTTRSFAREHPEAVRAFVAASIRGWDDFMNGDPTPAKAMIAARNAQMKPEFTSYVIKTMRDLKIVSGYSERGERIGLITRRRLQEQVDLLLRLKIVPAPLPIDRFVTFEFLPPDLRSAADH